ncbi:FecR domain-containing protein [Niabella sp.]|uniref:FecR family protein n=1 Tax=Niabella sp. TaxID=1962976 RepID=UPI0026368DE0|nr:FecR domain-containing protein [Niabella sp.]
MDKKRIAYLHQQHLDGNLSGEELQEWHALLNDSGCRAFLAELMDARWDEMTADDKVHLRDNRSAEILAYINARPQKKVVKMKWRLQVAAAAAVIFIAAALSFFMARRHPQQHPSNALARQVTPGRQGATLTLADGKQIRLTDISAGEIAEEAGISVTKTGNGELIYEVKKTEGDPDKTNVLATAKGETYILTLPDKSRVWLNAASSLTYSAALKKDGKRWVKLDGEAYFEIAKDPLHPFVVEAGGQEIQVLGTHFNVNSYQDESVVKTTLMEGSINVGIKGSDKITRLKPGQQSLLANGNFRVQSVDVEEAIAWKNGYFQFDGKTLETALSEIGRWYNVAIEYKDNSLRKRLLAGSISKYENVNNILKVMELTGALHFSLEGRKILVEKK